MHNICEYIEYINVKICYMTEIKTQTFKMFKVKLSALKLLIIICN